MEREPDMADSIVAFLVLVAFICAIVMPWTASFSILVKLGFNGLTCLGIAAIMLKFRK